VCVWSGHPTISVVIQCADHKSPCSILAVLVCHVNAYRHLWIKSSLHDPITQNICRVSSMLAFTCALAYSSS
jgi:hypothetical protein